MFTLIQTPVVVPDIASWVDIISNLGALGVLIVFSYLFTKGKIISERVADKMIKSAVDAVKLQTATTLQIAIKGAVKDGIVEAYYEIMQSDKHHLPRLHNTDDHSTEKEN